MQTYTIVSYFALGAVAVFLYRYYAVSKKAPVKTTDHKAQPVRKEPKVKKPREKKPPQPSESAPAASTTAYQPVDGSSDDEKVKNREFARQLTMAKTGTKVTTKKAEEKKIRSVKQSRAQEKVPDVGKLSAPSSTAGIDADDDQSAEPSPELAPADAGGVADMLEAPAPGPKSLRLTESTKEVPAKPQKAPEAPEPALTKKQRQNKKKAELKKLQREEDEKERKVKMEAQRRQARIAEGRPAQDGSVFTNQATNAWKNNTTNGPSAPVIAAPLDTFDEPQAEPKTEAKESSNTSTTGDWVQPEQWEQTPPEALEDEWSTVETKATKRKQRKRDDSSAASTKPSEAPSRPNGGNVKSFASQSSFAALNTGADSTEDSEQSDSKPGQAKTTKKRAAAPRVAQEEVEWD